MWLILAGPALLGLLILVIELAHIWLARVELENALGAAALAAVKEWGDAGGGSTECPRNIGLTYAAGNNISGVPLPLATNFIPGNPIGNPNGNDTCTGNLIFGAIIDQAPPFRFDAGQTPSCAGGSVALDITGQSSLGGNDDNSFGISFQPDGLPANSNLRITRVIYTLPETCNNGLQPRFDITGSAPQVSSVVTDCDNAAILQDMCPGGGQNPGQSAQADVFGVLRTSILFFVDVDLNDPCNPLSGTPVVGPAATLSRTLAVQFPDVPNVDLAGFDPEERIRFGVTVTDNGNNQLGADELGACGTSVTICFNDNTSITATFVDNDEPSNQCRQCVGVAPWGTNTPLDMIANCNNPASTAGNHGLIIHPLDIPDIPCPAGAGNGNNGQALVVASNTSGGQFPFAVRAQATIEVNSLFCELFGVTLGPFYITAKETAYYDCAIRCPRLIRIEPGNFICP